MKVALLSTNDYGGAARAAVRLCDALHKQDVVSDIFVKYKKSNLDEPQNYFEYKFKYNKIHYSKLIDSWSTNS